MTRTAPILVAALALAPAPLVEPRRPERDRDALIAVEQTWLENEGDPAALARILADDFVHPVPTGDLLTKAEHIRWSAAHPPPAGSRRRFEGLKVRVFGDVGIVNGNVVASDGTGGVERRTVFTDVFVLRQGRWQAVNGQENAVPAELPAGPRGLSRIGFAELMNRLAGAWNRGDARAAADCFTPDARYSSPPQPRVRRGRDELFRFFGGEHGRPRPMHMKWHHLVFDDAQQIGAGEYTFEYEIRTHGIALVRIVAGRIAQWREWEHPSPRSFEALTKDNSF